MGTLPEIAIKEIGSQYNKTCKNDKHADLMPGYFLNIMLCLDIAYFPRAILGFFFIKPLIEQATQADPECRFEE